MIYRPRRTAAITKPFVIASLFGRSRRANNNHIVLPERFAYWVLFQRNMCVGEDSCHRYQVEYMSDIGFLMTKRVLVS